MEGLWAPDDRPVALGLGRDGRLTAAAAQPGRCGDLFSAAAVGDVQATRALLLGLNGGTRADSGEGGGGCGGCGLNATIDVNVRDKDGATPMYIAAAHGHTELVKVRFTARTHTYTHSHTHV